MAETMENISLEISKLRKDVEIIKSILRENNELSDEAVNSLDEARNTPESKYVDLE